jgi:hypothetical protein
VFSGFRPIVESGMDRPPTQERKSRWQPPPDSDLAGIPLAVGVTLAVLAIIAAFIFIGWIGMVVLIAILIAALAISYRVITTSESDQ